MRQTQSKAIIGIMISIGVLVCYYRTVATSDWDVIVASSGLKYNSAVSSVNLQRWHEARFRGTANVELNSINNFISENGFQRVDIVRARDDFFLNFNGLIEEYPPVADMHFFYAMSGERSGDAWEFLLNGQTGVLKFAFKFPDANGD